MSRAGLVRCVALALVVAASLAGCTQPRDPDEQTNAVDERRLAELVDDPWLRGAPRDTRVAGPAFGHRGFATNPGLWAGEWELEDTSPDAVLVDVDAAARVGWDAYYARCPVTDGFSPADRFSDSSIVVYLVRALTDGALATAEVSYDVYPGESTYVVAVAHVPHHVVGKVARPPVVDVTELSCLGGETGTDVLGEVVELVDED